ncbi:MAG: hypothetical protein M3526_06755 [Actinomycetota bacterium]|nr:hypothetical protein [Actinomycetota bacterium]
MPGWREGDRKITFADMPEHLRHVDADSPEELKRQRTDWLEGHGLTLVDYFAWLRTQDPEAGKRPPSRRRLLTQEQAARLDAEIEREGFQW